MFHLVLHRPEIPPNTGNLMRLAANTGVTLHLIHPLGFDLSEKNLRRAGLDYHEWAHVQEHPDWPSYQAQFPESTVYAFTTKGSRCFTKAAFKAGDTLLFGSETSGLPADLLAQIAPAQRLRLPMQSGSRSLNLSNTAAIAVYEAWRQCDFLGGA